jgi:DNA-binding HxlR family transcriptional regulator
MAHDALASSPCPIGRSLAVLGERWSLGLVREAFMGASRFEDFQARTRISRNILADRLRTLTEHGVLERVAYAEHPQRTLHEYRLTQKGRDLYPVMLGLLQWGLEHGEFDEGECDLTLEHLECGGTMTAQLVCDQCGEPVDADSVHMHNAPPALVARA